jgi:hypothetical protein
MAHVSSHAAQRGQCSLALPSTRNNVQCTLIAGVGAHARQQVLTRRRICRGIYRGIQNAAYCAEKVNKVLFATAAHVCKHRQAT